MERLAPLLERLTNHEKTRPTQREWSLDGVRKLAACAGAPKPPARAVQVVGTKGKGTLCHYLAAAAATIGRRVGLYTSPHQVTILERIRVGGRMVDVEVLEHGLRRVLARARDLEVDVTFFEAVTLAAVECFDADAADFAIWEAGLGGRFDATTAMPVDATLLTSVEIEHAALLGDTIAAIATEKAQAMRSGGTAFCAAEGEAAEVFAADAAARGVRLFQYGRDYGAENLAWIDGAWTFDLRPLIGPPFAVRLEGAAEVEVPLAATAGAVLCWLESRAEVELARPALPGRFEVVGEGASRLVLDGAHTPGSMAAVARELARRWPGEKVSLLFASAIDKRWQEALLQVLDHVEEVVVTNLQGVPSVEPAVVLEWLGERGVPATAVHSVAAGLARIKKARRPALVAGSYYLVGAVRQRLGIDEGPGS